jgi:LPPG:FO 2-phospho-L-lactate transferase
VNVTLLAGGVGGAKMAEGLAAVVDRGLTVIVNTGDDLELHGLAVWPDHDTVAYTLAGLDDEIRGWGVRGESWTVMDRLEELGEREWFRLGDRDLATHLWRTDRLRAGRRPTEVALEFAAASGIEARILPMADQPVRTEVRTDEGWLEFQEYFVHRHQEPTVHEVRFRGAAAASATPEVIAAIAHAEVIVIAPSNPIVSIDPILAVSGIRPALEEARARRIPMVAISGIVGGKALKGPADRMLASLGEEVSALGVARRYAPLLSQFVLDRVDAALEPAIRDLGLGTLVADTIMTGDASRARFADEVLRFATSAAGAQAGLPEPR